MSTKAVVSSAMHAIFPLAEIEAKLGKPVRCQQRGMAEYDDIVHRAGSSVTDLAMNVWNRVVHNPIHRGINPKALKSFFTPYRDMDGSRALYCDPKIIEGMREVVDATIIRDISYSYCDLDGQNVARLFVAHVYPNDLHIADVFFCNPDRPLPLEKQTNPFRKNEGFGLLRFVLGRIDEYAKEHGMNFVTLTAADDDLVPLFAKYGFAFEPNYPAQMQRGMEKKVARAKSPNSLPLPIAPRAACQPGTSPAATPTASATTS